MVLLLLLAGCVQSGEPGDGKAPPQDDGSTTAPSSSAPAAADPIAAWDRVPLVGEWQRLPCDRERSAGPARNAWPPGPFNGSVGGLLRSLEDAMHVEVTQVHDASHRRVVAEVAAPNGTDTMELALDSPMVEWRLGRLWPGASFSAAWAEANRTLLALGLPPPDLGETYAQSPSGWSGRFAWSGAGSGLRELDAEAGATLSRGFLLPWPNGGRWPAGMDNASLEAAGQAFMDCQAGPGYAFAYASPIPASLHGSVARGMTYRLPTPGHHCGGPSHQVMVDAVTGVVLGHSDGPACI